MRFAAERALTATSITVSISCRATRNSPSPSSSVLKKCSPSMSASECPSPPSSPESMKHTALPNIGCDLTLPSFAAHNQDGSALYGRACNEACYCYAVPCLDAYMCPTKAMFARRCAGGAASAAAVITINSLLALACPKRSERSSRELTIRNQFRLGPRQSRSACFRYTSGSASRHRVSISAGTCAFV